LAFNVHDLVDTIAEDGPTIAIVGIVAYIGYSILKDYNKKGKVGK
jgi:hypothetical protein